MSAPISNECVATVRNESTTVTIPAGRFVKVGSAEPEVIQGLSIEGVALSTAAADTIRGVTIGTLRPGQVGNVVVKGPVLVETDGTVTKDDLVISSANGRADQLGAGNADHVCGRAIETDAVKTNTATINTPGVDFGSDTRTYAVVDLQLSTASGVAEGQA